MEVIFAEAASCLDEFIVYVSAMAVPAFMGHNTVSYSIVASGGIAAIQCPTTSVISCGAHGHSNKGVCVCDDGCE